MRRGIRIHQIASRQRSRIVRSVRSELLPAEMNLHRTFRRAYVRKTRNDARCCVLSQAKRRSGCDNSQQSPSDDTAEFTRPTRSPYRKLHIVYVSTSPSRAILPGTVSDRTTAD